MTNAWSKLWTLKNIYCYFQFLSIITSTPRILKRQREVRIVLWADFQVRAFPGTQTDLDSAHLFIQTTGCSCSLDELVTALK